jgi:hypothetical protein
MLLTSAIEKGKDLIKTLEATGKVKKAEQYQKLLDKVISAKDFIEILTKIDFTQPNEVLKKQAKEIGY